MDEDMEQGLDNLHLHSLDAIYTVEYKLHYWKSLVKF